MSGTISPAGRRALSAATPPVTADHPELALPEPPSVGALPTSTPPQRTERSPAFQLKAAPESPPSTIADSIAEIANSAVRDSMPLRNAKNFPAALECIDRAITLPGLLPTQRGTLLHQRGNILQYEGRFPEALSALRDALPLRDTVGQGYTAFQIAMCRRAEALHQDPGTAQLSPSILEEFATAEQFMRDALPHLEDGSTAKGDFHHNFAFCMEQQGRFEAALEAYTATLAMRGGNLRGLAMTNARMAVCLTKSGRFEDAETYARAAEAFYRQTEDKPRLADIHRIISQIPGAAPPKTLETAPE